MGSADYSQEIEGLACPDEKTLKITLTEPYPEFIYVMRLPETAPVAREAVEYYNAPGREGFAPPSRGHGRLSAQIMGRQHRIILAKSPSFRPDFYPDKRRPRRPRRRGSLRMRASGFPLPRRGMVDHHIGGPARLASLPPGVPRCLRHTPGAVRQDDHEEPGAFRRIREEGHIPRDIEQPRNLVHNFQYALPRSRPEQVLAPGPLAGLRQRPFQPRSTLTAGPSTPRALSPPGIFGYDPNLKNPYKAHDLARARDLLAKAGYPGGVDAERGRQLELTYDIGSDSAEAREQAAFDMRCFEQLAFA